MQRASAAGSSKVIDELAGLGIRVTVPASLTWVAKPSAVRKIR